MAILAIHQLRQPAEGGIVDCFGNIEAKIETAMVTTPEDQHELPRTMLSLCYPQIGVLLDQVVRIEEGSLVSQVLAALAEVLREEGLCLSLQDVGLIQRNAVPKLGLALMQEVDRGEVQVLLMPAEKGLPRANVTIGSGHSPNIAIDGIAEDGVEATQVPRARRLVHEGTEQISPVQGWGKDDILPKLPKSRSTISST